jgi:predicted ATPase
MLTHLRVKNFKAWRDTGSFRLAPLTVLFGANSAGKSSLGHLLLALKQTAMSSDRRRALHTGDSASLIDLGTFVDLLYAHDRSATLEFELEWTLGAPLTVRNPFDGDRKFSGDTLRLNASIVATKSEQPEMRSFTYDLRSNGQEILDIKVSQGADGKVRLESNNYRFVMEVGRKWPLDPPEKFYRISDRSIARYQNAAFLTDFALATEELLQGLSYLGPLREHPHRTYAWSGNSPEGVGQRGEYAIASILAADTEGRQLNRGPNKRRQRFSAFIASWLVDLGVIESFDVKQAAGGRKDYEVLVKTHGSSASVSLPDVGFGVSQLLPALVQAFYCPPHSIVWMEQPEIHLHPQVQSRLADVFISAIHAGENGAKRDVQLVIETHSEHFLNRLQRRIAEGDITPDDVAIYFCKQGNKGAELAAIEVNEFGDILNWPENFFGDEMEDLVARTTAAAARKASENAK